MRQFKRFGSHGLILFFIGLMMAPLYLAVVAASHEGTVMMHSQLPLIPGTSFFKNIKSVLTEGLAVTGGEPITSMLVNSLFMAFIIAVGKIILALGSAFALVYFDFPFKKVLFCPDICNDDVTSGSKNSPHFSSGCFIWPIELIFWSNLAIIGISYWNFFISPIF